MSQIKTASVIKTLAVLFFAIALSAGTTYSQSLAKMVGDRRYSMGIKNLKAAISAENPGLRRSAIYMAGKYQMKEVANDLFAQLKKESDPSTRILIGMSIYSLGDEKNMIELKKAAATEKDARVKRMFSEICTQFDYSTAAPSYADVQ